MSSFWIKNKPAINGGHYYPECSNCGYHWLEQCIGEIRSNKTNLSEAKYCPNCGERMSQIINYSDLNK